MTKATAPITGGMSWPPFEAHASTAAASLADMPERFMSGIVTTPTATVFAAAVAAHQRDGEVVEEPRAARAHEEPSHEHERDDHDHRDLQDEAEKAVVV